MNSALNVFILFFNPGSIYCLFTVLITIILQRVGISLESTAIGEIAGFAQGYLLVTYLLFTSMPKVIANAEVEYRNKYHWHRLVRKQEGTYTMVPSRMPGMWRVVVST